MDSGKWIAADRGAFEVDPADAVPAGEPVRFPLIERLGAAVVAQLWVFRETLPGSAAGGALGNSVSGH